MRMESGYLLTAQSTQAISRISSHWEDEFCTIEDCSLEGTADNVFGVMERVIKLVHTMEAAGEKDNFSIVGKCESDYDCVLFSIDYSGEEPEIKAVQAEPEEDEDRYYSFLDADYDEIPKLLKRNKGRTFKKAIKDDLPLGGFLDIPYEEWVKSLLK